MNHSEMYYARMQNAVENSSNGLYILYSNFIQNSMSADGKSALFACCDRLYLEQWKERKYTDLKPLYKVYQMKNDSEYAIFEVDLVNKKPLLQEICLLNLTLCSLKMIRYLIDLLIIFYN